MSNKHIMLCAQCPHQAFARQSPSSLPLCVRHIRQLASGVSWKDSLKAHFKVASLTAEEHNLYGLFQNFLACYCDVDADVLCNSKITPQFSPIKDFVHVSGAHEWTWITDTNAQHRIAFMLDWLAFTWFQGGQPHVSKEAVFATILRDGKKKLAADAVSASTQHEWRSRIGSHYESELGKYGKTWADRQTVPLNTTSTLLKGCRDLITAVQGGAPLAKGSPVWKPTTAQAQKIGRDIATYARGRRATDTWLEEKAAAKAAVGEDWFGCIPRVDA